MFQFTDHLRKQSLNGSTVTRSMSEYNHNLTRKLKGLIQKNHQLQKKIRDHENQIKDERTVLIYQMNELTKAVTHKIDVFTQYSLTDTMFESESEAHQNIKLLMDKYEDIEKEELMMRKIRQNLEGMFEYYKKHRENLDTITTQSRNFHETNQSLMKDQIIQKRSEISEAQQQNEVYLAEIEKLRNEMQTFKNSEKKMKEEEKFLRDQIVRHQEMIKEKSKKYQEMTEWTEIVIDKKNRYKVYSQISKQKKILEELVELNRRKQIQLFELKLSQ